MVGSSIHMVTNNPDQLAFAQQNLEANIKEIISTHPNLTSDQAAKIIEEIPKFQWEVTKNALWTMGKTNPDQMKQDIITGNIDIPAQYKNEALHLADAAKRDFDNQKEINLSNQKKELEVKQTKNFSEGVGLALAGTPLSQSKISELVRNGDLSGHDAQNLANYPIELKRQRDSQVENAKHPQELNLIMNTLRFNQMENNMNMSDKPIWDAWNSGKLSHTEFNEAMTYYKNANKPAETAFNKMLATTESAISNNLMIYGLKQSDPDRYAADLNSMRADAYDKLERARNAGEDVTKMLDPRSNDYIFKNASTYFTPAKQAIADGADKVRGAAVPKAGDIQAGYRFKGGDPSKPESWEKVQ